MIIALCYERCHYSPRTTRIKTAQYLSDGMGVQSGLFITTANKLTTHVLTTHPSNIHVSIMMTSSNGYIFLVAGPLCSEFTGHLKRLVTRSFDVFFNLHLNIGRIYHSWRRWFETPCAHYYVIAMKTEITRMPKPNGWFRIVLWHKWDYNVIYPTNYVYDSPYVMRFVMILIPSGIYFIVARTDMQLRQQWWYWNINYMNAWQKKRKKNFKPIRQ